MGLKRVSWVRRYQGQSRALGPLGHEGCRLRNHKKDQPLCSGYTGLPKILVHDRAFTHALKTRPREVRTVNLV